MMQHHFMYIQVEAPTFIVRGEQIGFRVTVFSYWYIDDYIEVSLFFTQCILISFKALAL